MLRCFDNAPVYLTCGRRKPLLQPAAALVAPRQERMVWVVEKNGQPPPSRGAKEPAAEADDKSGAEHQTGSDRPADDKKDSGVTALKGVSAASVLKRCLDVAKPFGACQPRTSLVANPAVMIPGRAAAPAGSDVVPFVAPGSGLGKRRVMNITPER